jgi:hypothetical protein
MKYKASGMGLGEWGLRCRIQGAGEGSIFERQG